MKPLLAAPFLALALILAGCGTNSPVPPPTSPPTAPPTTPPIAPTPPTQPPATPDVPYYGEWAWSFVPSDGCCNEEGRFSIVQVRDIDAAGSGFGFYQKCYGGNCYDTLEGGVIFGPGEDNTLTITLFTVNSANDFVAVYEATDDDGQLTKDDQGRDVFEGRGNYFDPIYSGGNASGTFRAILTGLSVAFPPVE